MSLVCRDYDLIEKSIKQELVQTDYTARLENRSPVQDLADAKNSNEIYDDDDIWNGQSEDDFLVDDRTDDNEVSFQTKRQKTMSVVYQGNRRYISHVANSDVISSIS